MLELKFLAKTTVHVKCSFFSLFKESVVCWIVIPKGILLHNFYNHITGDCLIKQFQTDDAWSHVRFISKKFQINQRNMRLLVTSLLKEK